MRTPLGLLDSLVVLFHARDAAEVAAVADGHGEGRADAELALDDFEAEHEGVLLIEDAAWHDAEARREDGLERRRLLLLRAARLRVVREHVE